MSRLFFNQAATFGRGLFCAVVPAVLLLAVVGCASSGSAGGSPASKSPQTAGGPPALPDQPALTASPNVIIGRILAFDLPRLHAVVDIAPASNAALPASFDRLPLLSRTDALQTTARLVGTDLRRGRTLGVRIVSGRPNVGDEVVWPQP